MNDTRDMRANAREGESPWATRDCDGVVNAMLDAEAAGEDAALRAMLSQAAAEMPEAVARFVALRDVLETLGAPVETPDVTQRVLERVYPGAVSGASSVRSGTTAPSTLFGRAQVISGGGAPWSGARAVAPASWCFRRVYFRRVSPVAAASVFGAMVAGFLIWNHQGPLVTTNIPTRDPVARRVRSPEVAMVPSEAEAEGLTRAKILRIKPDLFTGPLTPGDTSAYDSRGLMRFESARALGGIRYQDQPGGSGAIAGGVFGAESRPVSLSGEERLAENRSARAASTVPWKMYTGWHGEDRSRLAGGAPDGLPLGSDARTAVQGLVRGHSFPVGAASAPWRLQSGLVLWAEKPLDATGSHSEGAELKASEFRADQASLDRQQK